MSLATSNRDGGRTNEAGHLRGVTKGFLGSVLSGLNVSQRGAGANMSVDVAVGDAIIQRSDNTYGHPAWNDAVYNQPINPADGSNPRRDIVVMYIDYSQTPSTGVANNTNGVVKIKSVPGTAAGSPVDPSNSTIQSSVGSGNPFVKLARVRVAAGATSINNSVIDDLRSMAAPASNGGWIFDPLYTWVRASNTTFSIAGVDVRSQFPVGTKIMLQQAGVTKFFAVTSTAYSSNTTITVDGGGSYTLTNTPIDVPAFSYDERPAGYPYQSISNPLDWWQELGRVSGTNVTRLDLNITQKKYMQVLISGSGSASANIDLSHNGSGGGTYNYTVANLSASYSAASNAAAPNIVNANTPAGVPFLIEALAQTNYVRPVFAAKSSSNGVQRHYSSHANTPGAITEFNLIRASGTMNAEMIVLGHD